MRHTLNIPFEVKAIDEDNVFWGYGSVFGNTDLGGDIVKRGAFAQTLKDHQESGMLPQMFWSHDPTQVPGKWLEMREDDHGLYVRGMTANTQLGRDTRELLVLKAVRGLSIGFQVKDRQKDIVFDDDGNRVLKRIDLWEVSLVSLPMNVQALVEAAKSGHLSNEAHVPHSDFDDLKRSIKAVEDAFFAEIVR